MDYRFIFKKQNTVYFNQNQVSVSGPLGVLKYTFPSVCQFITPNSLFIPRPLFYSFINFIRSALLSVNQGWYNQLLLKGRGFKIFSYGEFMAIDLGYSNLVLIANASNRLQFHYAKNEIVIFSAYKHLVFDASAKIKKFYKLDRYHNKGIFGVINKVITYKKLM